MAPGYADVRAVYITYM